MTILYPELFRVVCSGFVSPYPVGPSADISQILDGQSLVLGDYMLYLIRINC